LKKKSRSQIQQEVETPNNNPKVHLGFLQNNTTYKLEAKDKSFEKT